MGAAMAVMASFAGLLYFEKHREFLSKQTVAISQPDTSNAERESIYRERVSDFERQNIEMTSNYSRFRNLQHNSAKKIYVTVPSRSVEGKPETDESLEAYQFDLNNDGVGEIYPFVKMWLPDEIFRWDGTKYRRIFSGRSFTIGSGDEIFNGFVPIYSSEMVSVPGAGSLELVKKFIWNGSSYSENSRFISPETAVRMNTTVDSFLMNQENPETRNRMLQNLEGSFGTLPVLNAMVFSTTGISGNFPVPSGIDYDKYLRVYSMEKTGGLDFWWNYKDRPPEQFSRAVFSEQMNYEMLGPKLTALVVAGKFIQTVTGNDEWTLHKRRLERSRTAPGFIMKQFRDYKGRDPTQAELSEIMRLESAYTLSYNPATDYKPFTHPPSTTTYSYDPTSRVTTETTTLHVGETPEETMRREAQKRAAESRAQDIQGAQRLDAFNRQAVGAASGMARQTAGDMYNAARANAPRLEQDARAAGGRVIDTARQQAGNTAKGIQDVLSKVLPPPPPPKK
jgi:hypothetical protein